MKSIDYFRIISMTRSMELMTSEDIEKIWKFVEKIFANGNYEEWSELE